MTRTVVLAALIGFGSTVALAGPSDHRTRELGDFSASQRPDARGVGRQRTAPYALTGHSVQRRVLVFRDVPRGRGQTERVAFWTWASE